MKDRPQQKRNQKCFVRFCGPAILWFFSFPVQAQDLIGLDCERFKPTLDSQGGILTEGGQGEYSGDLNLGFYFHYANDPLVLEEGDGLSQQLLAHKISGEFFLSLGFTDWLTFGAHVPAVFFMEGKVIDESDGQDLGLASAAVGDIRLALKFTLLREEAHWLSFSFTLPFSLPSGDEGSFVGSKSVTIAPTLALSKHLWSRRLLMLLNLGTWIQKQTTYSNLHVGHELFYRVGLGINIWNSLWTFGEINGAGRLENLFYNRPKETPLEFLLAMRYFTPWEFGFTLGAGMGGLPGWGTPNFRVFWGFIWTPRDEKEAVSEPL